MRRYSLLHHARLGTIRHWLLLLTLLVLGIAASGLASNAANAQGPKPTEPSPGDTATVEELLEAQGTSSISLTSDWSSSFTIHYNEETTSSYSPGETPRIDYAVPNSYSGDPTPLLVLLHGYGSTSKSTLDSVGPALAGHTVARNWLIVSVDMHNANGYTDFLPDLNNDDGGKRAFAWPGAQHDVIDAIHFMQDTYNVDTSRIYVAGGSMGGLTTLMMAAKYPDVFAAAAPWKPITDMTVWYDDLLATSAAQWTLDIRAEVDLSCTPSDSNDCGKPDQVPFAYERRSPRQIPQNLQHIPLHLWHDYQDILVPASHSEELITLVNALYPQKTIGLDLVDDTTCNFMGHCYNPPPIQSNPTQNMDNEPITNVFDFLAQYTLDPTPPATLHIRTDESKPFYWLNFVQGGSVERWSEVAATYDATQQTMSATVTDDEPLTVGFNLGSDPVPGPVADLPGLGMPAATYLVQADEQSALVDYTTGYLNVDLDGASSYDVTIAPITATISADPPAIDLAYTRSTSITVNATDVLGNPLPDGTEVAFATTLGRFASGSTATAALSSSEASVILTSEDTIGIADISVTIGSLNVSSAISIVYELDNTPPITIVSEPITSLDTVDENTDRTTYTLSDFFSDAEDSAKTLTYTLITNTNPDLFTEIEIIDDIMTVTYAPNMFGTAELTIRATDRAQLFAEHTFRITVNEVNTRPQAADDTASTLESTEVLVAVLGNDSDPDADPLSVTNVGEPAHGTASIAADGSSVVYMPNPGFVGEDSFVYAVSDSQLSATAHVLVTVEPREVTPEPEPEPTPEPEPEPTPEPTPAEPKEPSNASHLVYLPLITHSSSTNQP
jgi:pimeloyl-ACP methyl ester carboxylesterase